MRKRKPAAREYDRAHKEPALRCSICTGEQVAGFLERGSGRFEEVLLIRSEADLRAFCEEYGVEAPLRKIY